MKRAALLGALAITSLSAVGAAAISDIMFIEEESFVTVPDSVLTVVGDILPERRVVASSYLSERFDPNLRVTAPATVAVTFVHEGAGYRNSFGYFTYRVVDTELVILDRQLIFPNASFVGSGGSLRTGDTVTLRDASGAVRLFEPGEQIAFFVISNGWLGDSVRGFAETDPTSPSTSPAANRSNRTYTTLDSLNPEQANDRGDVARHTAMIRVLGIPEFLDGEDFLIIGMEDLPRDGSSDDDFNDVVFFAQSTPADALEVDLVTVYDPADPDPDGDGVLGLDDAFPFDADRAFVTRIPGTGYQTLAFEDTYPGVGDADFNDVVVNYAFEWVMDASNQLKDLVGTFHLVARGAGYDHAFGLALHGFTGTETGSVRIERQLSDGAVEVVAPAGLGAALTPSPMGGTMARFDEIFPSTQSALPPIDGRFTNTEGLELEQTPSATRIILTFDSSIPTDRLGTPPYDAFISVDRATGRFDIHRPSFSGFAERPAELPVEVGPSSFMDDNDMPWVLIVPSDWRYPRERVHIDRAYVDFTRWRDSRGGSVTDWYDRPSTSGSPVIGAIPNGYRIRDWGLEPGE